MLVMGRFAWTRFCELVPRESEIAVVGLARSGRAVALLLRKHGYNVYASDFASSPDTGRCAEELRAQGISVDIGRHDLGRPVVHHAHRQS